MKVTTLAALLLCGASAYTLGSQPCAGRISTSAAAMSVASPVAADAQLSAFNAWLEANGIASSKVKAARLPGWGVCLVAGENGVQPGDTLISVPSSLHLTPSKVQASPLGEAVAPVVGGDESALLALGLLAELGKGEAGCTCWPYLDLLPSADAMNGMPLLWSDDERARLLRGSHLDGAVADSRAMILDQWAAIEAMVLPEHPAELFPREVFHAAGYPWAHAIVVIASDCL